jgi:hydroxylamine reductase (hybrid-cluster protein)
VFGKILEMSIYAKAREKMGQKKKTGEGQTAEATEKDYLVPILRKLSLPLDEPLQEEAAISVQNEALRSLKERLLTRAEIIQRRLEEERKKLEQAHVSIFYFLI